MATSALEIVNAALGYVGENPITQADFDTPPAANRTAVVAAREYPAARDEEQRLHPWVFTLVRARLDAFTAPVATLTPGATTGTGVTFTASAAAFTAGDVGSTIEHVAGAGKALVTAVSSPTVAIGTITEDFPSTAVITYANWVIFYTVPVYGYTRRIPVPADCLRLLRVRHQVPYRAEGPWFVTDVDRLDVVYISRVTTPTLFDPAFDEVLKARLAMKFCYAITGKLPNLEALTQLYQLALQRAKEAFALEQGEGEWEENPAAITAATIIQDAVARVLHQPMTGPLDPVDLTTMANRLYPALRDELQRSHPWVFTLVRATLTATAAVPAFGFAHTMTVPAGALRILRVRHGVPYRHEGAVLVTDATSLDVVYIARVTDPTRFDAMYRHALTALLALRLAEGLPTRGEGGAEGRLAAVKLLAELFAASLVQAHATNAIEAGEGPYEASTLPDAMGTLIQEAVARLLAQPLAGAPDPIDLTTTANRLFPALRDELTRSHPWVFALVRVTLTATAAVPAHGFAHTIDVPADCLRMLRVRHGVPYRHEGAVLVTDAASLDVVYLRQITDVTLFDPTYRQTLVTLLALRLAEGLPARGDGASRQEAVSGLAALYAAALVHARDVNAIEQGEGPYEETPLPDTMGALIQEAVGRLLAQPIQGAPDPVDLTTQANRLYPSLRDELQRGHPWVFTLTRATLTAGATVPAHSFAHAIDVPADCLRLLRVRHGIPYRHEGAVLVTDALSLDVVYIGHVTDPTRFDPIYRTTLTTLLALRLAEGLPVRAETAEARLVAIKTLAEFYGAALGQAREVNAIEAGEGAYEENPADDTMGTIIQDAIGRLMAQPVQGAPDPIDLTAIANRLYPKLREELQRMHPWRFTRTRTRLDATTLTSLVPGAGAGTVTATGITFTTGGTFFEPTDIGLRLLGINGGAARITGINSTTVAVATIEGPWTPLEAVAAGDWHRAPSWRWTYRYPKPAGFLRLLETQTPTYFGGEPVAWAWWSGWRWPVHTGTGQPWEEPAVLEGEWIVSDAGPTLNIEYVQEITDPAAFEPSYAAVLAAFLAWRLALPARQPPQIEQILGRAFATQLKSVRTADKHDTRVPPMRYSPLTMVRY